MNAVLIAGSVNMDVVASAVRYPRLGETVPGKDLHFFPGGKGANQAVAAARLGAPTVLVGKIGRDVFGAEVKRFLAGEGIDLRNLVEVDAAPTGTALITVAEGDNAIVVVPGANGLVGATDVEATAIRTGDSLVSQFEIPLPAISAFFGRGRRTGARTILNPAPMIAFDESLLDLVDILVLNETEMTALSGVPLGEADPVEAYLSAARKLGRRELLICLTLGRRGTMALQGDSVIVVPGHSVPVVDTTGAGDCFVGALAARLAAGDPVPTAIEYANIAASISVQRLGAGPSMPTADEVEAKLSASPA